ncbi:hypothetical protein LTR94_028026 [Friedmanniomyces endolithicus]|nr:hypothetical protein LTR94_028026 [Friedmanniomyces endolithicus]
MAEPIKWRSKIILAKIEPLASYGVDSVPTGALNAMLMTNVTFQPMEGQSVSRNLERPYMGAQEELPVGLYSVLQGDIELVGSGSTGADIIGVGVKVEGEKGGLPRMAVMPASSVAIERNWDVIGLQGTGSHDLVVDEVVVPEEWTFIRGGAPTLDTPLYRYPSMAFAAQVLAIVGVGVARAALDEITQMAGGRASITGAPVLADRAYVQTEIAKAEAKLRSARAFFYEATEDVWATLCAGDPASLKQTGLLRLASSHVARIGCEVAQTAFMLSGTTGIYNDHPLAAYVHDAMVVAQHAFLSEGTFASAGRVLLGLDNPPGFP